MAKRVYSKPFTDEESKVFVDIVKKYKKIVENKETDGATTATKNKAWEDIAKEFNAQGISHFRNTPTLRTKWKALKKDARKENAEYRRYANGTGGGPPAKPVSTLYGKVLDVVDRQSIEGCKGSPDMEYESLHPNAPATPTIRHSLALYNGSEPSTSTSGPQHQCDIMDDIDYHIVEEMVDDPDVVMNTEVENSTQPSTDVHDKDASTIWNRSGYTSGMLAKPRSKLLRTSCRSVGKPAASRNYDVQSKNLSKKKDVLELQEQNFLKLQTMQGLEKELLEARIIREEELHKMDVASRQEKDKREEELYRMDVASKKAKVKRDDDIHLAEVTERHLRKQREKELFELAKKKLMLEVDILKKDLGNNNE